MRIRPYIPNKDFEYIAKWIDNERTHAFWSANRFPYPITPESFHDFLEKISIDWTDSAYVATENNGQRWNRLSILLLKKRKTHCW